MTKYLENIGLCFIYKYSIKWDRYLLKIIILKSPRSLNSPSAESFIFLMKTFFIDWLNCHLRFFKPRSISSKQSNPLAAADFLNWFRTCINVLIKFHLKAMSKNKLHVNIFDIENKIKVFVKYFRVFSNQSISDKAKCLRKQPLSYEIIYQIRSTIFELWLKQNKSNMKDLFLKSSEIKDKMYVSRDVIQEHVEMRN